MEIDSGSYIHEDLMSRAYYAKDSMDRRPIYFDYGMAKDDYKSFLEEKVKAPTRANLAMQKVYNKEGINYPEFYRMNKRALEKNPEIDMLVKKVIDIESKQPKTSSIRKNLIAMNQVQLDTVTPKLKNFQKFVLKIKSLF